MFGKWPNRIVVFCSAVANDPQQKIAPVIATVILFIRMTTTCLVIEMQFNPGCLEHQLHPSDDLIELVITELGIRFAEVGPSMDVVDHQLEVVTTNVVIQASCD
jgi:hypothetical protein